MRTFAILLLVFQVACSVREERPADLLPRDKFTEVLLEAQLIEAGLNDGKVIDANTAGEDSSAYAAMFKAQGVTEQAFSATFEHYVDHPAELKEIYSDVLAGLQKRVDLADSTGTLH